MVRLSAILAAVFALFLGIGEAVRNWGDWQWWPFWLVDYIGAGLLLIGAVIALASGRRSWLAGAWGFVAAMFYMSFFAHIERLQNSAGKDYGPGGALSEETLTLIIGVMLATAAAGFLMALLARDRH